MRTIVQTQSIAWAHGVRVALEAEGIQCTILNEFDRGPALMPYIPVRVVVLNDEDVERAQAIAGRLTRPHTEPPGPPPSWRWQKRGLLLFGLGFVLNVVGAALLDDYQSENEGSLVVVYVFVALGVLACIIGLLLIALGPRADRAKGTS